MKQFELGQLDSILLNLSNNGRTGRCHQSCVCLATESEQQAVPGEGNCQLGLMVDTSQQRPPAISQQQQQDYHSGSTTGSKFLISTSRSDLLQPGYIGESIVSGCCDFNSDFISQF